MPKPGNNVSVGSLLGVALGCLLAAAGCGGDQGTTLLNVSYDPTREFFKEYNEVFAAHWAEKTGERVVFQVSNGGSGKQARSVLEGLEASVVTLALAYDIDAISRQGGLLPADWQKRLPHNSCAYTSTIVLLVYKQNPRGIEIRDWDDLVQPSVEVVTPNPKTSGGARWNYLAAWGYVLKRELGDLKKLNDPRQAEAVAAAHRAAHEFVSQMFRRVKKLDTGARGSTMSFTQGIGDVLLAWENEALWVVNSPGGEKFKIVYPSVSIRAEPPMSLVDQVVDRNGTREVAQAYLEYLYSAEGQTLAAKHHYRPAEPDKVPRELLKQFADIELFGVDDVFGGWQQAQQTHFAEGGTCTAVLEGMGK